MCDTIEARELHLFRGEVVWPIGQCDATTLFAAIVTLALED
jgi:hypothetical protein